MKEHRTQIMERVLDRSCRIILGMAVAGCVLFSASGTSAQRGFYSDIKRFTYDGDIRLIYRTIWTDEGSESVDTFTPQLRLGLNGYILDPRLASFRVGGRYAQDFDIDNETSNYENYGFYARLNLLNQRPRHRFWYWMPQPISLRYSKYFSERSEDTNYGVSLSYSLMNRRVAFFHNGRVLSFYRPRSKTYTLEEYYRNRYNNNRANNRNRSNTGNYYDDYIDESFNTNQLNFNQMQIKKKDKPLLIMTFPTFYFSYDKYIYDRERSSDTEVDTYSVRGQTTTAHSRYAVEYNVREYDDSLNNDEFSSLNAYADYSYKFNSVAWLDSLNRFNRSGDNDLYTTTFSNSTFHTVRLGRHRTNTLNSRFGFDYTRSFNDNDTYSTRLGGTYAMRISERVMNSASAGVGYGWGDNDSHYSVAARDTLSITLTRRLRLSNGVGVSNTDDGTGYNYSLDLTHNWFVNTNAGYTFQSFPETNDGRRTEHTYRLEFLGRLFKRMQFRNLNKYFVRSASSNLLSFDQNGFSSSASIRWALKRFSCYLGGTFSEVNTDDGAGDSNQQSKSVNAGISGQLTRRARFFTELKWQEALDGTTFYLVRPNLTYRYRKTAITAEYRYTRQEGKFDNDTTTHDLYVRLMRSFGGVLF